MPLLFGIGKVCERRNDGISFQMINIQNERKKTKRNKARIFPSEELHQLHHIHIAFLTINDATNLPLSQSDSSIFTTLLTLLSSMIHVFNYTLSINICKHSIFMLMYCKYQTLFLLISLILNPNGVIIILNYEYGPRYIT